MIKRTVWFISVVMVLSTTGCIKETYDMNKLAKKIQLSPAMAISAIKGDISFSDMVKSNDTVVFDQNKLVNLVFKKDSVINLKMSDFYDLSNMVSLSQTYTMGELTIADFQSTLDYTLYHMSQFFPTALRNQFATLDDGFSHPFPALPSVTLGEEPFPSASITNFENAVFASGFLDITVLNTMNAPLKPITLSLFNTSGHSTIAAGITIPAIASGQSSSATIDLTDRTVTNSILAAINIAGSNGNATPGIININTTGIQITIKGRDLKVKSGRIMLPTQTVSLINTKDTMSFDPGTGIEIDSIRIETGNLSYHIRSATSLSAALTITITDAKRNGTPVSEIINVGSSAQFDGNISFDNTVLDLGVDPLHPFNRIPVVYGLNVTSNNTIVSFNSNDQLLLDMKLLNPAFDFVKGFFGQRTEIIKPDSLKLDIKDFLNHISSDFLIANPSIKLNYSNSFSIPLQINLIATGKGDARIVDLGLDSVTLEYPLPPDNRDLSSSFTIDSSNSALPELISLPPEMIRFSGSAKMNPAGNNSLRDNYVYDKSRFLGSLEIAVPMEFRMTYFQFADTLDNFLKADGNGNGSNSFQADDFEYLRIRFSAKNGFPLGASLKMILYNSVSGAKIDSVSALKILDPAPVGTNGEVIKNEVKETITEIELTKKFFSSVNNADRILFSFMLNTTNNGTIKILSDYKIVFTAALVAKADIKLK